VGGPYAFHTHLERHVAADGWPVTATSTLSPSRIVSTSNRPRPDLRRRAPSRGIGDALPEHWSRRRSQDGAARRRMGPEVDVPAERHERGEIGDGRLEPQDDQRGIAGTAGVARERRDSTPGSRERIEIIAIGDAVTRTRREACPGAGGRAVMKDHSIFCRQSMGRGEEGTRTQSLPARLGGHEPPAVVEQEG